MEVYLTLATTAFSDHQLQTVYRNITADLVRLCEIVVEGLSPEPNPQLRQQAVEHLYALVDGLALHALHDETTPALQILRTHLATIADT